MNSLPRKKVPSSARVVIVGGGIMGCGLAYHLTRQGWRDVVLFEKAALTSGSTWHAAGQITRSTSSLNLGKVVDYNISLYSHVLEQETGQPISWHGCGSLRLAYTEDEADWLRHTLSVCRSLGVEIELVCPERIRELHQFYSLEGVICALHTPDDGYVDPAAATQALAIGARNEGAKIITQCRVQHISNNCKNGWRVMTELGDVDCEHVVNAGGTYARQVASWNGLELPTTSMTHHYIVTDSVPEFKQLKVELPVVRDDRLVSGYVRMEQMSGLIGIYEKENPNTVWDDFCPWDSESELFDADYERIMPWLANAMERMPVLKNVGIKRVVHGAISHPPDGNPLIGPAPETRNYWYCCGTQIGIGWGPGLTRELASWMIDGASDISMREFDPRRFGSYATKKWQIIKAKEDYCLRHEIQYPNFNRLAGRPIRKNPLYDALKEKGAVFEEVYGHERPRWFSRNGVAQHDHYSYRRNVVQETVGQEVAEVRKGVGVMDITAFAKVELTGQDAAACLDTLIANRIPRKTGSISLTHMLNKRGRIELELTAAKLDEDRFYLICAAFYEQRLLDQLKHHKQGHDVFITNRSNEWSALALQGPKSRAVLAAATDAPLDNASFRWFSVQEIVVANHPVWALRVSYSGELGWELHGNNEAIAEVYRALWSAGEQHGITDYGSFAMNVMRMEKMYKGVQELTNEVTLPEADVMRFVDLSKSDFLGRSETIRSLENTLPWKCVYLSIEPDGIDDGNGGEAVLLDGLVVGSITSIAYSYTVETILAFAYVQPQAAVKNDNLEVMIAGKLRKATLLENPVYDPGNLLPRSDA